MSIRGSNDVSDVLGQRFSGEESKALARAVVEGIRDAFQTALMFGQVRHLYRAFTDESVSALAGRAMLGDSLKGPAELDWYNLPGNHSSSHRDRLASVYLESIETLRIVG